MADTQLYPEFQEDLRALLNRHNLDNACNTPDFMLAGMLTEHLETYRKTTVANRSRRHSPNAIGREGQSV